MSLRAEPFDSDDKLWVCIFCLWTATDPTLSLGSLKSGNRTLAQSDPLLLRYCGKDADHGFLEDAGAVEVLFSERPVIDAVTGEPMQVIQRLHGAFAAEAIQAPEQKAIKLPPGGRYSHPYKLTFRGRR